jgi:hypothetical protein
MWQVMWMLGLLPDWFWHILTVAGAISVLAAWFLSRIPFISQYGLLLKIAGTVVLLLGLWMEGGIANEAKWRAKVADLEAKVAEAQVKSDLANDELDKALKQKTKIVKEVQVVIQERIRTVEKKIDADCKVVPEVISIHNDSARNIKGENK